MKTHTCGDCEHYYQHYALNNQKLFRVFCGHCKYQYLKKICFDNKACENFSPGPKDTDHFVCKEYLSKELLQYLLRLELLPENIEDLPHNT